MGDILSHQEQAQFLILAGRDDLDPHTEIARAPTRGLERNVVKAYALARGLAGREPLEMGRASVISTH